mgnify:CR=1 FL=1
MNREQIIQAIRHKVKEIMPHDSTAILFGSQARGDAHSESDWDVLILLNKDRVQLNDYDAYSYPLREMGWELGADINPILYTKSNWEKNRYTPFYKNVTKEGKSLL